MTEIPLENLQFFLGDRHLFGPVVEDRQRLNIDDAKRRAATFPAVWRGFVGVVEKIVGKCFGDRVSRSPFAGAAALCAHGILLGSGGFRGATGPGIRRTMEGSRRPVACRICAYALAAPLPEWGLAGSSPGLGETAIRGDEPLQHRHDEPDG